MYNTDIYNKELDTTHRLFFIDYCNGFEKRYYWFDVKEDVFNLDWTAICNGLPSNYTSGLGSFGLQKFMHINDIFYLWRGNIDEEKVFSYINATAINKERCKIIEHRNIGNY